MFAITRRYHFEAAHYLPLVRDGHKCKNMHGHNYEFEITLRSSALYEGFIIDFWDLDAHIRPILDEVDHKILNDIEGLDNPTAELIADWLMLRIRDALCKYNHIHLKQVQVWETKDCSAIFGVE